MEWINIHHSTLVDPAFISSDTQAKGAWLSVLAYACHIECGGRIPGAGHWTDRQWIQAAGVTMAEVAAASGLLRIDGADVIVNGYPTAAEAKVKTNRTNAKKGAMARWGNATANADLMPCGMPCGNAKGEGEGEGEGEGAGNGNANAHGAAAPHPADRRPYDRFEAQYQTQPPPIHVLPFEETPEGKACLARRAELRAKRLAKEQGQ